MPQTNETTGCERLVRFVKVVDDKESVDIAGGYFQVFSQSEWRTFPSRVMRQCRESAEGKYSSNGRNYFVNFGTMVETNVETGIKRKVRLVGGNHVG